MFEINSYIQKIKSNENYLEKTEDILPDNSKQILQRYIKSLTLKKAGKSDYRLDLYYCELNSEINVLENSGFLSSEQAWYLRNKYF